MNKGDSLPRGNVARQQMTGSNTEQEHNHSSAIVRLVRGVSVQYRWKRLVDVIDR